MRRFEARRALQMVGKSLAVLTLALTATAFSDERDPAPAAEPKRERIGAVLGEHVYRDQLEGDPPTYGDVVQLFMAPALAEYGNEHGAKFEMTDDEIRTAAEWMTAEMRKRGGEDWERWQTKSRESQADAISRIGAIEAKLRAPETTEPEAKQLRLATRLANLELAVPHASEAWFLFENRKFEQYLYDNYGGGRIIHQQLGPEALDARRDLLLKLEAAGKFEITDPALRKLAYDYWERPAHPGGFHTDRRLLAFPWTEEYQAMEREDDGSSSDGK